MNMEAAIAAAVACLLYILTVRFFRHKSRKRTTLALRTAKYSLNPGIPSSTLIYMEACRRSDANVRHFEFPFTYRLAVEFSLFRTYAIPSISALLPKTRV